MAWQSFRHAFRLLRRSPGFTVTAVLTLALGIGANTAVFSVVHAVLLRPLPYANPDRLISLEDATGTRAQGGVRPGNLFDYRQARSLAGLAGYNRGSQSLTRSGPPEQVLGEMVTWNLFDVAGVAPAIGRAFHEEDSRPGSDGTVILTHAFWQRRFGGDPRILGRALILNDRAHTVVGVMPDGFQPFSQPGSGFRIDFLVPVLQSQALVTDRSGPQINAIGRLAPGVSIDQARAELQSIAAAAALRFPATNRDVTAVAVAPLRDQFVRPEIRLSLLVMLSAVGLVLIIASVNLGSLLLARAIEQQREIATRMAVGATRGRMAADLAVRGLVLGVLGGGAGLLGGLWIREALVAVAPPTIPGLDRLGLDPVVLAVTLGVSLVAGVAAGLLPAIHVWRGDGAAQLGASGRTVSAARSAVRWRGVLMAAQVAAALVLMIGAGLLGRSLLRLTSTELGFRTDRVLMFTLRLPPARYPDVRSRLQVFDDVERRIGAVAGVLAVGAADALPMRGGWRTDVIPEGGAAEGRADMQLVSPGYFPVLRMAAARGRLLGPADRTGGEAAAVVSEAFVRRFLAGGDPIGQRFRLTDSSGPITIAGVVGDARRDGYHTAIAPQVYLPAAQAESYPAALGEIAVLGQGDPRELIDAVQAAVWSIDPDQPITHLQLLDDVVAGSFANRRFTLTLFGALAALAIGLALVGVYGVAAHLAAERRREIGIRVALGADRRRVLSLILSGGMRWAAAGIAAGLAGALALSRFIGSLLFGVAPADAITFAAAAALAAGVAWLASYLPARRAASADPLTALRAD